MANTTHFNETTTFQFRRSIWINDLVISSILAVVAIYFLTSLLYHQVKIERRFTEGFFQLPLEKRYGMLSKYTCICIGFASLFRQLNSVILLAVEGTAVLSDSSALQDHSVETVCDVVAPIGIFALTLGSGLVYLFLWFRQRVFYVHSSLKVLNNKYVRFFSFAIIFCWFIGWISLIIAYFVEVRYRYDENGGCLFEEDTGVPYGYIIVSWSILSIMMQLGLLWLFTYPILKRTLWIDQQQQNGRNDCLNKRVKKAVILASICLCTDIFSLVTTFLVYEENTNSAIFMYSVNLVINHLITIVCFDHWKKLLWPWNVYCQGIAFHVSSSEKSLASASASSPQLHTKETILSEKHNFGSELKSSAL